MAVWKTVTVGFDWGFGSPTTKSTLIRKELTCFFFCSRKSYARHVSSGANSGKNIRKTKYEKSADA